MKNRIILTLMLGMVLVFGVVTAYEYGILKEYTNVIVVEPSEEESRDVTNIEAQFTENAPMYAGSKECSESEKQKCRQKCINKGPPYKGGNWFLNTKCERANHVSYPNSPTKYSLKCTCMWGDYGWGDTTIA